MKQDTSHRIAANEINRYMYCPYQWYYKRVYGNKALHEQYKELGISSSKHEDNYTKGMAYHTRYHAYYRIKRIGQWLLLILLIACILKVVMGWPL